MINIQEWIHKSNSKYILSIIPSSYHLLPYQQSFHNLSDLFVFRLRKMKKKSSASLQTKSSNNSKINTKVNNKFCHIY